jgi:hypothetical protein
VRDIQSLSQTDGRNGTITHISGYHPSLDKDRSSKMTPKHPTPPRWNLLMYHPCPGVFGKKMKCQLDKAMNSDALRFTNNNPCRSKETEAAISLKSSGGFV